MIRPSHLAAIGLFLLCAIAVRAGIALSVEPHLDSDEAVEALQARDLWQHPRFIVGWPGQDYMGSAEIYALSAMEPLTGWSARGVRWAVLIIVTLELTTIALIAYRAGGTTAALIALAAMCGLLHSAYDWELRARSYNLPSLLMLIGILTRISMASHPEKPRSPWYLFLGLLGGLAVWSNELMLLLLAPFVIPSENEKTSPLRNGWFLSGFLAGLSPRIAYNFLDHFYAIEVLVGSALGLSGEGIATYGWRAVFHRPASSGFAAAARASLSGLGPILILLLLGAGAVLLKRRSTGERVAVRSQWLTIGLAVSIILLLLAGSTKARYSTLAIPYAALFAGLVLSRVALIRRRQIVFAITLMAAGLAIFRIVPLPVEATPDTTQNVVNLSAFIQSHGYRFGIASADISPLIMFYDKDVSVSALAGPLFQSRFLPVERAVAQQGASFVVYDTANGLELSRALTGYLESNGISFSREVVGGEFAVYDSFSRPVFPGAWLPPESLKDFERHSPENPRKITQEDANELRIVRIISLWRRLFDTRISRIYTENGSP